MLPLPVPEPFISALNPEPGAMNIQQPGEENCESHPASPDSSDSFLYGSRVKRESPNLVNGFNSNGVGSMSQSVHNLSPSFQQSFPSFSFTQTNHTQLATFPPSHLPNTAPNHHTMLGPLMSNGLGPHSNGFSATESTRPHLPMSSIDNRVPQPPTLHLPISNGPQPQHQSQPTIQPQPKKKGARPLPPLPPSEADDERNPKRRRLSAGPTSRPATSTSIANAVSPTNGAVSLETNAQPPPVKREVPNGRPNHQPPNTNAARPQHVKRVVPKSETAAPALPTAQTSFHASSPMFGETSALPDVRSWTVSQVMNWLLTFPEGALYVDQFARGLVNGFKLANMNEGLLKSFRISSNTHRQAILHQRHLLMTRNKKQPQSIRSVEESSSDSVYLCYYCDVPCSSKPMLRHHMQSIHNIILPNKPSTKPQTAPASTRRRRRPRSKHYSETTGRWHCPDQECKKTYASRQALRYHASTKHNITIETGKRGKPSERPKNKQFPCPICSDKVYASKQYLKVHVSNVHHTSLDDVVSQGGQSMKLSPGTNISIRPPADLFHSMPKIEDFSMRRSDSDASMSDADDSDEDGVSDGGSSRDWNDAAPKIGVDHNSSESDSGLLSCPACGDVFYSQSFLDEHMLQHPK